MEGLRDTGYTFDTAVADIIDNSIAAGATRVDIIIDLDPQGNIAVYFADDGIGMNQEELYNAMKYGSNERSDPSSLGKFGLGLKTASTAFCRCLSVVSIGNDSIMRKVQWDLDYICQINEWRLRILDVNPDEEELLKTTCGGQTGTLVIWDKVDRLIGEYKTLSGARNALKRIEQHLKFHISMVYQRFLDKDDTRVNSVQINLNGEDINPWDPFCSNEEVTIVAADQTIPIDIDDVTDASSLNIKAVIIPRRDEFSTPEAADEAKISNDMQGFYVYRENRLIHYGDWMGMFTREPHGTLLRVALSFEHTLDEAFYIDIKKSRILLNEALYDVIRDEFLPGPRRAADERYRYGKQKVVERKSINAHAAANRNIDSKASELVNSKIEVKDFTTGEVNITNAQGTFRHRISVHTGGGKDECRVIPVETLDSGILWKPSLADGKNAVEINMGHPYYQKVYYPVLNQNVMVTGMDALLWALAEAENSTFNNNTREHYEEMRYLVSKIIRNLVADLPDPATELEE